MGTTRLTFRMLLIDDDKEMNDRLEGLLRGIRLFVDDISVVPQLDRLDVVLERMKEDLDRWWICDATLECLHSINRSPIYDLVLVDYGFTTEEAQDVLWGKDRKGSPSLNEAEGKVLTVMDLQTQFRAWESSVSGNTIRRNDVFASAERVLLRTFVRRDWDILGPVTLTCPHFMYQPE